MTRLARFRRPGHRILGRSQATRKEQFRSKASYLFVPCVVDDLSRYAYVEQHRDNRGETAAAALERERFIQTLKRE